MSETLVIIKPDAVARLLVGKIITRIEEKGLFIVDMKLVTITPRLAAELYDMHRHKQFFGDLCKFIASGPAVVMIVDTFEVDAIPAMRRLTGAEPADDPDRPGSIRGDFASDFRRNCIHSSDTDAAAPREIRLFFPEYAFDD